jgi:hypothetical protein
MNDSAMERAVRLVLTLLPNERYEMPQVETCCDDVLTMLGGRGEALPDRGDLIRQVESMIVIQQDDGEILEDSDEHVEWLDDDKSVINWEFWDRYRRYLEDVEFLPPQVVSRLDVSTDRVLGSLNNPKPDGRWDRRGLVVGHVQSGKTAHYTGLACKSVDAGYSLIIVLAGMHDSLRSQTQFRLDQGLLGFDTQFAHRSEDEERGIGVGAIPGAATHRKMASLTTSKEDGDFQRNRAQNLNLPLGQIPILLVVKKNAYILKNLNSWLSQMHGVADRDGNLKAITDVPLLVIDDEADNASVNTKKADEDPGTINGRIRELLNLFHKSAYVGYTATPFANIFASTDEDETYGRSLFPQSFVESLKPPSNYFGPVQVFGLDTDGSSDPAPVYRGVRDHETWMPDRHKKHWRPPEDEFPESLQDALLSFMISSAVRRVRGDANKHHSMLVHTTRFVDVQKIVAQQVEDRLLSLRYALRYGTGEHNQLKKRLRRIWVDDYVPASLYWADQLQLPDWQDVEGELLGAAEKAVVKVLNGQSDDALLYYENREKGVSVIAIGGDKLSRGLTLEGLSVSYYLRASKMYDTLLQMGRWFGYRPRYEDVCRLYTTPDLFDWYRQIATASEELRLDFDDMASRRATPRDYGLRVRQSPDGLMITSPAKMRTATKVPWSYSGEISESVTFSTSQEDLSENLRAVEELLQSAGGQNPSPSGEKGTNLVWSQVEGAAVADFFNQYRADTKPKKARPELLERYIRDALAVGELGRWTVVLINKKHPEEMGMVAGHTLGLTVRKPLDDHEIDTTERFTIGRLVSPADEAIDLDKKQRAELEADNLLKKGPAIRERRAKERGLLLLYPIRFPGRPDRGPVIGFAASFPKAERTQAREYRVNEIYQAAEFGDFQGIHDETD